MRAKTLAFLVLLAGPNVQAVQPLEQLRQQALAHYAQALASYGVAIGEHQDAQDPAALALETSVADLLCLRLDAQGCLAASREAGRSLGPYLEPLTEKPGEGGPDLGPIRSFLHELHQLSGGYAKDRSVLSECLALLDQVEGDRLRAELASRLLPDYLAARKKAKEADGIAAVPALIRAGQLAALMLDAQKLAESTRLLEASASQARSTGGEPAYRPEELQQVLSEGRDAMIILGDAEGAKRVETLLASLQTKALTPPDLGFELGPAAEAFSTDPGLASAQLRALALRAPLRSRASSLLTFASAYAGTIAGIPDAADPLSDVRETLRLQDPYLAARASGLLGRSALLSGDYEGAARELAQAASEMNTQRDSQRLRGLMLASRAQALFYLGKYADAAQEFESVLGMLADDPSACFQALVGWSHSLVFAGKPKEAEALFLKAEALLPGLPKGRSRELSRALRLDRALGMVQADHRAEAVALLSEVAKEALDDSDVRAGAIAHTNLAELYNDQGEAARALVEAEAALRWLDPKSQADAAWQALTEKGRALSALDRKAEAVPQFKQAMDLVETLRSRIGAEGSRRSFAEAKTRLYREMVSLLERLGKHAEAFQVSERARSRAFLDMLGERRLRLGREGEQALLGPARDRMLKSLPPLALGFDEPGAALAKAAVAPAQVAANPQGNSEWLPLVAVRPADLVSVQAVLEPGEALLSTYHDGKRLQLFLVQRQGITVAATDIPEQELANQVDSFLRVLQQPHRGEELVRTKGERLYQLLLMPVVAHLKEQRVVVVPWGPLHGLPWAALWDGKAYLVDRAEWSTVPSASTLVMIRKRRPAAGTALLALGNPVTDLPDLPAAAEEVQALGRMFPKSRVHLGAEATKASFLQEASGANVIHVASHGVFVPEQPMNSYLALSAPSPEKGRLSGMEILGLDLSRVRLVVLSACATGQAEVQKGDELIGLSRAFLHAGSSDLLASLWSISDDSTRALVTRFYEETGRGKPPSRALALAERAVKKSFAHPYFWASFALIGG